MITLLRRHNWFTLATIFFVTLLSFGQLQRWQVTPTIAFYFHDVVAVVISGWYCWKKRAVISNSIAHFNWLKWRFTLIFILVVVLGWGLAVLREENLIRPLLYVIRLMLYSLTIVGLSKEYVRQPIRGISLTSWWLGSGLLVVMFGLLQYWLLPDTRFLSVLGWDDHYFRLISTLFDPAFTGMVLVLLILVFIAQQKNTLLYLAALVATSIALGLTFSRSSFVALGVGLLVLALLMMWRKKLKAVAVTKMAVIACMVLVTVWLAPKPTGEGVNLTRSSTITARSSQITGVVSSMQPVQWLVGTGLFIPLNHLSGPATSTTVPDHAHAPDNILVFVLYSFGVVGCLVLALALYQQRQLFRGWSWWAPALVLATLTHSLFNNTFFQPFIWLYLWGLLMASRLERDR